MRVKICGITRVSDALAAEAAGADAIGLMFVPESPRCVTTERARELVRAVAPFLVTVGVFRDAPLEVVLRTAEELRLGAVQLHGSEDAAFVASVRSVVPVIRAVSFGPHVTREYLSEFGADAVLLDGLRPGSGKAFDWEQAWHLRGVPRLVLAGGLHPRNVASAVEALQPWALDVSSGVESEPGIKDGALMDAFVRESRLVPSGPRG